MFFECIELVLDINQKTVQVYSYRLE